MRLLAASIVILLLAFSLAHASYDCTKISDKIKSYLSLASSFEKRAFKATQDENKTAHNEYMAAHHTMINQAAKWSTIFLARCS